MKIINEEIRVQPDPQRTWAPLHIEWRKQPYSVIQVIDNWKVQTRWWAEEVERLYVRVSTNKGMMEIYRQGDRWTLYRIDD